MITLIIDTSTDRSLIAITQGSDVLLKTLLPPMAHSSSHLMATVAAGLVRLKLSPASLEAVAVSVGPGSYTGIRVGVAAAKGLAVSKSLPLVGFCSLEGFICENDGRFASLIDAKIGGMYVLLQERKGNKIHILSTPQLISAESLDLYLESYPTRTGPHIGYPDSFYLARLIAQRLENKEYGSDLELIYLRIPEYQTIL